MYITSLWYFTTLTLMTEIEKVSKTTVFNPKLHTFYSLWTFKTMLVKNNISRLVGAYTQTG